MTLRAMLKFSRAPKISLDHCRKLNFRIKKIITKFGQSYFSTYVLLLANTVNYTYFNVRGFGWSTKCCHFPLIDLPIDKKFLLIHYSAKDIKIRAQVTKY